LEALNSPIRRFESKRKTTNETSMIARKIGESLPGRFGFLRHGAMLIET
jgi:hypothetical protein